MREKCEAFDIHTASANFSFKAKENYCNLIMAEGIKLAKLKQ
jgi:hypothetical protein